MPAVFPYDALTKYAPVLMCDSGDRYLVGAKVYGRIVTQGGITWLQYWVWLEKDLDHPWDWEHVAIRWPMHADVPDLAVLAKHRTGRAWPWEEMRKRGTRPLIYLSRDKHAAHRTPGFHRRGRFWLERADGKREIDPPLLLEDPPDILPKDSPQKHAQWKDPNGWLAKVTGGKL